MPTSLMWQLVRVPWSDICKAPVQQEKGFQEDRKIFEEQHGHVLLQEIQKLKK